MFPRDYYALDYYPADYHPLGGAVVRRSRNPHLRHMNLRATVHRNADPGVGGPTGDELFDPEPVEGLADIPCMLETIDDTEVVQQNLETPVNRWYVVFAQPVDVAAPDLLAVTNPVHPEYGTRTISVVGPLVDLEGRGVLWQVRGIEHP